MTVARVSEWVARISRRLNPALTDQERALGVHLRGNKRLLEDLQAFLKSRIEGRARLPLPSNPIECYGSMARDKELLLILGRLELVFSEPINTPSEGEQPE